MSQLSRKEYLAKMRWRYAQRGRDQAHLAEQRAALRQAPEGTAAHLAAALRAPGGSFEQSITAQRARRECSHLGPAAESLSQRPSQALASRTKT